MPSVLLYRYFQKRDTGVANQGINRGTEMNTYAYCITLFVNATAPITEEQKFEVAEALTSECEWLGFDTEGSSISIVEVL
jgi:hypothetical protein